MTKRELDIVVISDVHLGTFGCHADELNTYLKYIKPKTLILNGDILDMWQFRKYYFPESHMKVLKRLFSMMSHGTTIYYLTGNHDESLRRFSDMQIGNLQLRDKLLLNLDGKQAWFFHGDIFDVTMRYSKVVAKMGGFGYDLLILLNRLVNFISVSMGRGKMSISKKIKNSVKSAIKFVDDFEETATDLAIRNGYDYVICGHIHRPAFRQVAKPEGDVVYLNSGDWIENLTSLEYHNGEWKLHQFNEQDYISEDGEETEDDPKLDETGIPAVSVENMILEELLSPSRA